uniref:Uncharacterized protein n=1 Tax=Neobodo designis TaxID=312471 RepID=A0A6U4UM90_NEODS|mmetsp:Transcript_42121/g.130123  ORF Transcript_42121/g.130123 Transcript_42121/m.130123 type:complete len:146 (+) Transcript_42121:107-544(+)|eukprot:CAMPEP_0174854898 /NCGR_PEP_ID=MMETSP1114-20130205/32005_1 /TAXON_ID=312471 /ORGANISM="Neobodo designis, Strain CCAP 1951/1" /LENGTH=145 /DNA_ID=CAMNT_0016089607 /DNA_START=108 /DNA_END=545 /DNA_ORIENTATION=-
MSAEASNENVNLLLTKIMTDRFCKTESHNLDACVENYVPQKIDGSYIDQSLQRRGLAKCQPYKEDAMKCLQDEKRQTAVIKAASRVPSCKEERAAVAKCQRAHPGNNAACEGETLEMIMCGLVYILQKQSAKRGGQKADPADAGL